MNKTPLKEIKTEDADLLAVWHSIQSDLKKVIDWLTQLTDGLGKKEKGEIVDVGILESLWISSVIVYARCFHGGKRKSLDSSIYKELNGDPIGAHKYYLDMRDKRIAHSVNSYEQYKTGMIVSGSNDSLKVDGVMPVLMQHSFPTKDGCQTLLDLCKVACNYATGQIKTYLALVEKEAKALNQAEIEKANNLGFTAPGPKEAGKTRDSAQGSSDNVGI
jgi:hypothetical protein